MESIQIQIQIQSKEEEEMAVVSECHLVASWREEVAQGAPAISQRRFSQLQILTNINTQIYN